MKYRRLGKSGLQVSELSFGSWITFANQIENGISEKLMDIAYDAGVNFFDNAEVYAAGKSEEVMGDILKKKAWARDTYIVSSKAFFGAGGKLPTQRGLHRKHLVEACESALKRLQVDYLDLYFCHRPDKETPMEETVWTMHQLIMQGKILYWGTSEWSAQEIMEAHMVAQRYNLIGPTMEQPQYNMLTRRKVEVEYAQIYKTVGLGTTIWSPLASGYLTGKYIGQKPTDSRLQRDELNWLAERTFTEENENRVMRLQELARDLGISLPKLGVAWCLKNQNVSTVILGASKPDQLVETLAAADAVDLLTNEVMEKIEDILQNKPSHPPY
ncbi:MAG: potassium channel beta subunit family protein [Flavobacteriales bacterium]|jgi:voltage-dependent potassium channel beta subunit